MKAQYYKPLRFNSDKAMNTFHLIHRKMHKEDPAQNERYSELLVVSLHLIYLTNEVLCCVQTSSMRNLVIANNNEEKKRNIHLMQFDTTNDKSHAQTTIQRCVTTQERLRSRLSLTRPLAKLRKDVLTKDVLINS